MSRELIIRNRATQDLRQQANYSPFLTLLKQI